MRVDFDRSFIGMGGEPMKENIAETIATYMFNLSQLDGKPIGREQKMTAYRIYTKMVKSPSSVDMTTEEATFIKDVCGENLTAGAYGQIEDLIENN